MARGYFNVAGEALCASLLRGRCEALTLWELPVRAWSPLARGILNMASAGLFASEATLARASMQLVPSCFYVAGAVLRANGRASWGTFKVSELSRQQYITFAT